MKHILPSFFIFFALGISLSAMAQVGATKPDMPMDESTKKVTYSDVVDVPGVSAADLYKRSEDWFNSYFKSPSSVIQSKDADGMVIKGKHGITIYKYMIVKKDEQKHNAGLVKYSIEVASKDGKYRYVISEIFKHQSPKLYIEEWMNEEDANKDANFQYLTQIDEHMKALIEDLHKAMASGDTQKADDW